MAALALLRVRLVCMYGLNVGTIKKCVELKAFPKLLSAPNVLIVRVKRHLTTRVLDEKPSSVFFSKSYSRMIDKKVHWFYATCPAYDGGRWTLEVDDVTCWHCRPEQETAAQQRVHWTAYLVLGLGVFALGMIFWFWLAGI